MQIGRPDWKALTFKPEEEKLCLALTASCQIVELGVIALEGQRPAPAGSQCSCN